MEAITLGQVMGWLGATGAVGTPLTMMTIMWWLERKERIRLQGIVEGFLPSARSLARSSKAMAKVFAPEEVETGDDV